MNIFLPYENDIGASVQSLDDVRLNKQILECYQLVQNCIKENDGEKIKGYKNHPVYVFYKNSPDFLIYYGKKCCDEYFFRFRKKHKLNGRFWELSVFYKLSVAFSVVFNNTLFEYTPFYMEGSKGQPNYIRTTENVSKLFQAKLCKKWEQDKAKGRMPKWTNRQVPEFYRKEMMKSE